MKIIWVTDGRDKRRGDKRIKEEEEGGNEKEREK